jgi:site-specific recombinase XerD
MTVRRDPEAALPQPFAAYVVALTRRGCAPSTLRSNRYALARLARWLEEQAIAAGYVSLLECERYFAELLGSYAVATARQHLAIIRGAYRYAVRHGLAACDPTVDVRLPRLPDREPVIYSNGQLRAIYAVTRSPQERLLFKLFTYAGLRLCEATSLTWSAVWLEERQLTFHGKGGKLRTVPLHATLLDELAAARPSRADGTRVLRSDQGRPLASRTWITIVRKLVDRAAITTTNPSHAFRRTVASELYRQGIDTPTIDKLLGWAPRTVRDRHYLRIATPTLRAAINALYQDDPILASENHSQKLTAHIAKDLADGLVGHI